jgi:hypothetical protein
MKELHSHKGVERKTKSRKKNKKNDPLGAEAEIDFSTPLARPSQNSLSHFISIHSIKEQLQLHYILYILYIVQAQERCRNFLGRSEEKLINPETHKINPASHICLKPST